MRRGVRIGVDVGRARVGVARSDRDGLLATPVETIQRASTDVVARLRTRLGPQAVVIGVGGISSPADARAYLTAGATLVQGYTGFIYAGPFWASRINRALAAAVGARAPMRGGASSGVAA